MSHFTVLVVGENPEEQLEPFWELDLSEDDLAEDPRAVFDDKEEEFLKEYTTGTVEKVLLKSGEYAFPWEDIALNECKETTNLLTGCKIWEERNKVREYCDSLEKKSFTYQQLFPSFEEFMLEWHTLERDSQTHKYGWGNPNAKWDWHQLGGRWTGYFKAKPGTLHTPGIVFKCRIAGVTVFIGISGN